MSKPYEMPPITLGPCLWRLSPDDGEWAPAMVTEVAFETINVSVFAPDNQGVLPRDGVRHVDDPFYRDHPNATSSGCWDYCELERRTRALERAMGEVLGKPPRPAK